MDPFTIATTATSIVGACAKLSNTIFTYIQSTLVIDTAVDALRIEVDSLAHVLDTLGSSFKDASLAGTALELQTGHEGEHWRHVKRSMDDCMVTLENFQRMLDRVNKVEIRGIMRRSIKKVKLDLKSGDIDLLKQQIAAYRRTMQLSLQLITVSSVLSNESLSTSLSSKLDSLTIDIHELFRLIRRAKSNSTPDDTATLVDGVENSNTLVMHHLEDCVQSAGKMISSAATIVESRSVRGTSEFGDHMNEDQRRRVEQWIPKPPTFEYNEEIEVVPPKLTSLPRDPNCSSLSDTSTVTPSQLIQFGGENIDLSLKFLNRRISDLSLSDPDSDIEYEVIQHWLKLAADKFEVRDYLGAESFLKKILVESQKKYGEQFLWRDETTKMLAIAYCHQAKWTEADVLFAEDFKERSRTIETLAMGFFLLGKKEEAGKICLGKQFEAREKIVELLATSYYHEKKWGKAKIFLIELLEYEMEEKLRLERMHTLAEICFAAGDLEDAKTWCTKAVQGRLTTLGKRHYLFYQSVNLLAQIYDAKGEFVEAEGYKAVLAVLPPGLQECVEIEQLCHLLDADEAANLVGRTYFKAVLSEKSERKEVQRNIRKSGRGIIGSGHGWALIHAFAAYGRELAVQLLLEKGTDIEAHCDKGTALTIAALYGREGMVKLLLEKKANIEARNKYGSTPLIVAAVNGYVGIVQLLLEKGANIEGRDNEGNTALMSAARYERVMMVELLIARGANVEVTNLRGLNALNLVQSRQASRALTLDEITGVHRTPTVLLLQESARRARETKP